MTHTMRVNAVLLNLMSLGPAHVVDVIRTSDGHYIGKAPGDVGYNVFLGTPKAAPGPGWDMARKVWDSLTGEDKEALILRCENPMDGSPIPLADFGIVPPKSGESATSYPAAQPHWRTDGGP